MVYARKRDLLEDHPRYFGIGRQSKHNGSGSLWAQHTERSTAPREGRVNQRTNGGHDTTSGLGTSRSSTSCATRVESDAIQGFLARLMHGAIDLNGGA